MLVNLQDLFFSLAFLKVHFYLQTPKKTTGKENSNPNLQNIVKTASTTGALGTRQNMISPNVLIQAATKNNRMFREMVSHNLRLSSCWPLFVHLLFPKVNMLFG